MSDSGIWIFGYGSLVWRPAFPYLEKRPAVGTGWARRLWQGSPDHRGTPELPGRVVTMLRWPSRYCTGMAYRIGQSDREELFALLDAREVAGYERVEVPLQSEPLGEAFAVGVAWVATTSNPSFLGMASHDEMVAQISRASGLSGTNREYVIELADALSDLGATEEDPIFEIAARLRSQPGGSR